MTNASPHDNELLQIKRRRLEKLQEQEALKGFNTPPEVSMEIEEIEADLAKQERTQLVFQAQLLDLEAPPPTRGLILLVSPLRSNANLHTHVSYQAIDYHRSALRRCWLIATDGEQGSLPTADMLKQHFAPYGVNCEICLISNGGDAAETQVLVASIYNEIAREGAIAEAEVIADITGGTKAMTAGVVLACGATRPMQYMLFQQRPIPSLPVLLHTHQA